jgi:hypothetical protein
VGTAAAPAEGATIDQRAEDAGTSNFHRSCPPARIRPLGPLIWPNHGQIEGFRVDEREEATVGEEGRTRKKAFWSPLPLATTTTNTKALRRQWLSRQREGGVLARAGRCDARGETSCFATSHDRIRYV